MFCWSFDHSTWGRFYACVVWILDSYVTQPTCWSLPYREAYFNCDTYHWPQKERAHKNFRYTKPLSDFLKSDNRGNKTWEWRGRSTHLIRGMSHLGTVYRLLRRIHQRRNNTAKLQCGLSWWRTSQNNSRTSFLPKILSHTQTHTHTHLRYNFHWQVLVQPQHTLSLSLSPSLSVPFSDPHAHTLSLTHTFSYLSLKRSTKLCWELTCGFTGIHVLLCVL